ncbi:hypothetical protein L1987_04960 [Smallanthus sonchifolius]|uniref:Uncharacterized protein n=1 Tax=Smallanthus sonchifolius TaxID=185202 RepID=A0ACB9JU14_9ASTR|nr:hypothetical protein L1987_04960 [Smallanthus sonchifolius]
MVIMLAQDRCLKLRFQVTVAALAVWKIAQGWCLFSSTPIKAYEWERTEEWVEPISIPQHLNRRTSQA